jgi:filamentous hemagglutinin
MESIKPAAEALAQLHPGIAASVAVTGEEATGGKASTWERCAAGIQAFGGILAKGVGWAGRGIGQWFGIGRAAEEAAVVGKEASVVAHGWIDPGKLGYMFGEAGGRAHNVARTAQNAAQLARVGVYDTVEGRALLQAHLESVVMDPSNVVRTYSNEFGVFQIRESLFAGPGGFLKLESSWQVLEGGVFRFTSAIPMGGP